MKNFYAYFLRYKLDSGEAFQFKVYKYTDVWKRVPGTHTWRAAIAMKLVVYFQGNFVHSQLTGFIV